MSYNISKNIVEGASLKQLWMLRDFQEKYHPELPCPCVGNGPREQYLLSQWYGTIAKLYLREIQGLPI